jgi:hypothetical protein
MDIKCWNSRLDAWGLKIFIVVVHIATKIIFYCLQQGLVESNQEKKDKIKLRFDQIWC